MQGKFLTVLFWGQLTLIPKCDKDITQDRKLWRVLEVLTNVTRETNERKAHSLKMEQTPPPKKKPCHYSQMIWFLNQKNTNTNLKKLNLISELMRSMDSRSLQKYIMYFIQKPKDKGKWEKDSQFPLKYLSIVE